MKKKMSVRESVIDFIKKYPKGTTTAVLTENLNKPANQIHTTVWKLVKGGTLNKADDGTLSLADPLNHEPIKVTSRRATSMEMHLADKVRTLEAEVERFQSEYREAQVKYYDAMAVIRYLEAKLITLSK